MSVEWAAFLVGVALLMAAIGVTYAMSHPKLTKTNGGLFIASSVFICLATALMHGWKEAIPVIIACTALAGLILKEIRKEIRELSPHQKEESNE